MRQFRNIGRSLITLGLTALAFPAAASSLFGGSEFYKPSIEPRTFLVATDGISSPADTRLDLTSGTGTIEFWVRPGWQASGGGARERFYPLISEGQVAVAVNAAGTSKAAPRHTSRYAIYMNDKQLALQFGEVLCVANMTKATQDEIAEQAYLYVVVAMDTRGSIVYINGRREASFAGFGLPTRATSGNSGSGPATAGVLLIGGRPDPALLGEVQYVAFADRDTTESFSLSSAVRAFEGELGGVRVWSRMFPIEHYVGESPPLTQRGPAEVRRSTAFPDVKGDKRQPNYGDLIAYADFSSSSPELHRVALQWPVSGIWLNETRIETRPAMIPPPGLDDVYGNADDYPVFSVTPTRSPDLFLVHEDDLAIGALYREQGQSKDRWTFSADPMSGKPGIEVTVREDDRLSIRFSAPSSDFGGNQGAPTSSVTLRRPNLDWKGGLINPNTGFFNQGFLQMSKVCYRAFDARKMSRLYAYQGETGSAKHVFAEPGGLEYSLDKNGGGKVVPFGFSYIPVGVGRGASDMKLCTSQSEVSNTMSTVCGSGEDVFGVGNDREYKDLYTKGSNLKSSSAIAVARSYNRDFMLAVDKSQARLSPDFVAAIQQLRVEHDKGPGALRQACDEFIEVWGTHYSIATTFGGMLTWIRSVSESELKSLAEGQNELTESKHRKITSTVNTELSAQPLGLGVSLGMGVTAENGDRSSLTIGNQFKTMFGSGSEETKASYFATPSGHGLSSDIAQGTTLNYGESGSVPIFFDLRLLDRLLCPTYFSDPVILGDVRTALRERLELVLANARKSGEASAMMGDWAVPQANAVPRVSITLEEVSGLPVDLRGTLRLGCITKKGYTWAYDEQKFDVWGAYDGPVPGVFRDITVPIEAEGTWSGATCGPPKDGSSAGQSGPRPPIRGQALKPEKSQTWDWPQRTGTRPKRYAGSDTLRYEHWSADSIGLGFNFMATDEAGKQLQSDAEHAGYMYPESYQRRVWGGFADYPNRPLFVVPLPPSGESRSHDVPLGISLDGSALVYVCADLIRRRDAAYASDPKGEEYKRLFEETISVLRWGLENRIPVNARVTIAYDDGKVIRRPRWSAAQVANLEESIQRRADSAAAVVRTSQALAASVQQNGLSNRATTPVEPARLVSPDRSAAPAPQGRPDRPRRRALDAPGSERAIERRLLNRDSLDAVRAARRDSVMRIRMKMRADSTGGRQG